MYNKFGCILYIFSIASSYFIFHVCLLSAYGDIVILISVKTSQCLKVYEYILHFRRKMKYFRKSYIYMYIKMKEKTSLKYVSVIFFSKSVVFRPRITIKLKYYVLAIFLQSPSYLWNTWFSNVSKSAIIFHAFYTLSTRIFQSNRFVIHTNFTIYCFLIHCLWYINLE